MPSFFFRSPFNLGLYDSSTDLPIEVSHAVDVSDICFFRADGCVLLYGRAERGPLVQILRPYDRNNKRAGCRIHYFIDELEKELQTRDTLIHRVADDLGLTVPAFIALLRRYAPQPLAISERQSTSDVSARVPAP